MTTKRKKQLRSPQNRAAMPLDEDPCDLEWLRAMVALEEELGEIVPGGAQGGVAARRRRKEACMTDDNERDTIPDLAVEIDRLRVELKEMTDRKEAAYEERDYVVALMVRLAGAAGWPFGLLDHEGEDWGPEWKKVVVIETPEGQMAWHFPAVRASLFEGIPAHGRVWDGHTTDEKYRRLKAVIAKIDGISRRLKGLG